MKKAAMVLGIVGGSIYLFIALIYIITGVMFLVNHGNPIFYTSTGPGGLISLVAGLVLAAGAGLGIAGGVTVIKHNTASGVMMLIGCVLNFFNILLLLGGIFALIPEKRPQYPPYPYPPYPYPPYPPYPNQLPYVQQQGQAYPSQLPQNTPDDKPQQ